MYLSLQHISKTFNGERPVQALADVSFSVAQGEFVSLIGQSGSGKSTLCNLIAGLIVPDSGEIRLNGALINGQTGHVGYMPQRDLLMPWRTVLQNVTLGAEIRRLPLEQAREHARALLPLFGLEASPRLIRASSPAGCASAPRCCVPSCWSVRSCC